MELLEFTKLPKMKEFLTRTGASSTDDIAKYGIEKEFFASFEENLPSIPRRKAEEWWSTTYSNSRSLPDPTQESDQKALTPALTPWGTPAVSGQAIPSSHSPMLCTVGTSLNEPQSRSVLEELLQRKYGTTMNKHSYNGNDIGQAAEKGAWGRLLQLLDTDRSTINSGATFGYSALMTIAACPHDSDGSQEDPPIAALLMRCLIEAKCNVNQTDSNHKNALHACAKFGGSVEQLSILVNAGVDQAQRNGQGQTPCDYIKIYKRFSVEQAMEAGMTF
jgi:hypothetical protein